MPIELLLIGIVFAILAFFHWYKDILSYIPLLGPYTMKSKLAIVVLLAALAIAFMLTYIRMG
jgi:antibiotic biosynthesis monooxygenase (ABM) superfamily enzyme